MRGRATGSGGDPLKVEVERQGSTAQVAPIGELDLATAPMLMAALERLEPPVQHVVLDLRGLSFLDSTGLETILRADAASRRDGFNLSVVKAKPSVHRVFVLSGLDQRLVMVDDPGELAPPAP